MRGTRQSVIVRLEVTRGLTVTLNANITVSVPAIEKLVDYLASGVGVVGGTMLASWRARNEAKARLIAAQGEV